MILKYGKNNKLFVYKQIINYNTYKEMSESYIINFTNYKDNPYFTNFTATADRVTFYKTDTINFNKNECPS